MKVTGTIAKCYDEDCGEYIGVPYKNMDVVINEPKEENKPYSRVAFRLKGEHLERFKREVLERDAKRCYTFDLVMEVEERTWKKDDKVHPSNRMPVCVGWE